MPGGLRVLTWNVADLRGDLDALGRVLRSARPDVVCLQEAHRGVRARPRLEALARGSGLLFAAGGRGGAGTAVLTAAGTRVLAAASGRLPTPRVRASAGGLPRPVRPRGWAAATVAVVDAGPVHVVSVHLGLHAPERTEHAAAVLAALPPRVPAVVAGDLNERPGGPAWVVLQARLDDPGAGSPATFPAHRPRHRIDVLLATPGLTVTGYGVPAGTWSPAAADVQAASDHLPVVADVAPARA